MVKMLGFLALLGLGQSAVAATIQVPDEDNHITTIADALAEANDNDDIVLAPGEYKGPLVIDKKITLRGSETARTVIKAGGDQPMLSIHANDVTIRYLTFDGGETAIDQTDSIRVTIEYNIFVDQNSASIDVIGSSDAQIQYNTFYSNTNAVLLESDQSNLVERNIFARNDVALPALIAGDSNSFDFNCYFNNSQDGGKGENAASGNPMFIDPGNTAQRDFHIQETSACKSEDPGDTVDTSIYFGTYGGNTPDLVPLPAQGVGASLQSADPLAMDVQWQENLSYLVGGYRVYFSLNTAVDDATTDFKDAGDASTVTLVEADGLTKPVAAQPGAVTKLSALISNQRIRLSWAAVDQATGYDIVATNTANADEVHTLSVTNASATISGLTNDQTYSVSVTPYYQASYYIAVRAYDSVNKTQLSALVDGVEKRIIINDAKTLGTAAAVEATPQAIQPYPDLPNEGCYIATAAYGFYSAPQVQVLRDFRDQYLLTNSWGRALVAWYYRTSPPWAAVVKEHAGLRAATRIALLPLLGVAYYLTHLQPWQQVLVLMLLWFTLSGFVRLLGRIRLGSHGE